MITSPVFCFLVNNSPIWEIHFYTPNNIRRTKCLDVAFINRSKSTAQLQSRGLLRLLLMLIIENPIVTEM